MISPFGVEHGVKCDVHGDISKACWDNYKQKGMKVKGGRMVPNCVPKKKISKAKKGTATGAMLGGIGGIGTVHQYTKKKKAEVKKSWQTKEGKNPKGGLNEKGRKSYERENPGSNLKPPVKRGNNPRRASFLARMGNMPGPERKPNGEPTRLLLSLQAWGASSKADAKKKAASLSARNSVSKGMYIGAGDNPLARKLRQRRMSNPTKVAAMNKSPLKSGLFYSPVSKSSQTSAVKWARRASEMRAMGGNAEKLSAGPGKQLARTQANTNTMGLLKVKRSIHAARQPKTLPNLYQRTPQPYKPAPVKPRGASRPLPSHVIVDGQRHPVKDIVGDTIIIHTVNGPKGISRSKVIFPKKRKPNLP